MSYLSKVLIIIFLTFASVANASNNSFVGVIGAAIGDIKNQKKREPLKWLKNIFWRYYYIEK